MNIFSNHFDVEFDERLQALLIWHPDRNTFKTPLVSIPADHLKGKSLEGAAAFIGERLILLIPALREMFADYLWSDDGRTPPKLG